MKNTYASTGWSERKSGYCKLNEAAVVAVNGKHAWESLRTSFGTE